MQDRSIALVPVDVERSPDRIERRDADMALWLSFARHRCLEEGAPAHQRAAPAAMAAPGGAQLRKRGKRGGRTLHAMLQQHSKRQRGVRMLFSNSARCSSGAARRCMRSPWLDACVPARG